jgi:hypothetical protein
LCPGSHHAEAGILDESTAAADDGTLLHPFAINPKLKRDHLTDEQQQRLAIADQGTKDFKLRAAQLFNADSTDGPPTWSEVRLPLYGPDKEELFDGQADIAFAYYNVDAVAVQDFKMGRVEVTEAADNWQIASYGIMWADYLGMTQALVAINQPLSSQRLTVAHYSLPALDKARRQLAAIYHAALDKDAPRIASDKACHFCKAKIDCEEYRRKFKPLYAGHQTRDISSLDNEVLTRLGTAIRFARRLDTPVMTEIAKRIESGEITNWYLKETGETRELTDIVGAYRDMSAFFDGNPDFNGAKFSECTTLSWSKLTALVKGLTGYSEGRAKRLIDELLNHLIVRTPKQPTPTPKE